MQIVANGTDSGTATTDVSGRRSGITEPRLLVFGRLATHKRVDLVLRAVAELVNDLPELRVDVVGKGPEEERLHALVDELGLGDVVVLHGFLPDADKQAMLHRSRLQVCASDAEGWGQVVIEAATYGVPTLARDVPGPPGLDPAPVAPAGWCPTTQRTPTPSPGPWSRASGWRSRSWHDASVRERYRASCRAWGLQFSWGHMRRQVTQVVEEELSRAGR